MPGSRPRRATASQTAPAVREALTYQALAVRMAALLPRLRAAGHTVATAESCTGGLLGAILSEASGSSAVFAGGAVVYSNAAKTSLADVPPQLIHGHGAVSSVVAAALARGIRLRLGAAIGLGITGIAGPSGATPGKPVGLMYVAIDSPTKRQVKKLQWRHDRAGNRLAGVGVALDLLAEAVE